MAQGPMLVRPAPTLTPPTTPPVPMQFGGQVSVMQPVPAGTPVVLTPVGTPRGITREVRVPMSPAPPVVTEPSLMSPMPSPMPVPSAVTSPVPSSTGHKTCPLCHGHSIDASGASVVGHLCAEPLAISPGRAVTPPRLAAVVQRPASAESGSRAGRYGLSTARATPSSSPVAQSTGASRRPRSATSRSQDFPYLSIGPSPQAQGSGDRLRQATSSARMGSPMLRAGVRVYSSPRVTTRTGPSQDAGRQFAVVNESVLQSAWAELREHVAATRRPLNPERPEEGAQLDASRTRRIAQIFVGIVNQIQEPSLRRVLAVLAEELFSATFKDYTSSYDPRTDVHVDRQGRAAANAPIPCLNEEQLATAVPYFAVVQSLRDTAKDAIMRRLEAESKGSDNADTGESKGRKALEEVRLREELRHARLLADTYQARTLELEKMRIDLEDQVRRGKSEREQDQLQKQKLNNEVKRLRADSEMARQAKQAVQAEKKSVEGSLWKSSRGIASGTSKGSRSDSRTVQGGFGRASRGLVEKDLQRSPRKGLQPSATEPSPRKATGLNSPAAARRGGRSSGSTTSSLHGTVSEATGFDGGSTVGSTIHEYQDSESAAKEEARAEPEAEDGEAITRISSEASCATPCSVRLGFGASAARSSPLAKSRSAGSPVNDAGDGSSSSRVPRRSSSSASASGIPSPPNSARQKIKNFA
eukprot:TRINITY_DN95385_c0_g1_i1.p1 TRINITY_DN95385_c0_g1~~TRINITY_DN95385_c0_g1_i1.p1  ORF type:complete len:716 (+),score=107.63 TRINITY_DN95385_c0_g1_i1:53-2149(+)